MGKLCDQLLDLEELREAVAFDSEDTAWKAEKIPQRDFVVGSCANLVVVDRTDKCVRFAHPSVKQYLEKNRGGSVPWYPTAAQGNLECGEFCVSYLSFSDFSLQLSKPSVERAVVPRPVSVGQQVFGPKLHSRFSGLLWNWDRRPIVSIRTFRTRSIPDRTQYKFLNYAIENWGVQTKEISRSSLVWEKFENLATSFNEIWNFHPWIPGGRSRDSHLHALFGWAVKEQRESLLSIALAAGPSLQRVCDLPLIGESLTALHVASKLGYENFTRILLGFCKVNVEDSERYSALHHAASRGHLKICQMLSSTKRVKLNSPSISGETPLWLAASNGHAEVVLLLIQE
ncbi:hypothetical protein SI65_06808 [Aspergillus cristatus]|uniref:Uncharacterized protein n=1 Tax=Aspergillus cristatus TaxID=573508 RepID=A0A1E3BAL4_ASPCR|nr:hypothetical protein SI65_06808 [Aspergillus cristatus]